MEDLQKTMEKLVGIVREEKELKQALEEIEELKTRAKHVKATGDRIYNAGWHYCLDLKNLLTVSEAITRAALERKESRGGHTRLDYPDSDKEFGKINIYVRKKGEEMQIVKEPLPQIPSELLAIIQGDVP